MAISTSELHSQYDYMRQQMMYDIDRKLRDQQDSLRLKDYYPNLYFNDNLDRGPVSDPKILAKIEMAAKSKLLLLCEG